MMCNARSACLDHAQQLLPERLAGGLAGAHVQALQWQQGRSVMPSAMELHMSVLQYFKPCETPPDVPYMQLDRVHRLTPKQTFSMNAPMLKWLQ